MPNLAVVSLGCDKNRVDTERAIAALEEDGWNIVTDVARADAVFINTCAFIESAKKESLATIFEFAAYKEQNPDLMLIVTGCLPQRYADAIRTQIPEIDVLVGTNDYAQLPELVRRRRGFQVSRQTADCPGGRRVLTTLPHYAYLKIADGCDNCCTYCAIPSIRGRYRSYPMPDLVQEARELREEGVKELILVAQDTTRYGVDLYGRYALGELMQQLDALGFARLRLMYAYPERVDEALLGTLKGLRSFVPYLDVPLQHVSDGVLARMNRRMDGAAIDALLARVGRLFPELTLRSTFLVGFPGESEQDFEQLRAFIAAGHVPYAGFFAFSREEGTGAYAMPQQIPAKLKRARVRALEEAQSAVTAAFHDAWVGATLPVLYEGIDYKRGKFYGRAPFQTPEVDPVTLFSADFPVEVGQIYQVRVTRGGANLVGVAQKE